MKSPHCIVCGSNTHTKTFCWSISKKRIRPVKPKAYQSWQETVARWKLANPPDINGNWRCYLHISPMCLNLLDNTTLTLDHVKPKGSHRNLKHDIRNLRACCAPCNSQKGSRSLESVLIEKYKKSM